MSGCLMPWLAQRQSPPSSMLPPWSLPVCTWWRAVPAFYALVPTAQTVVTWVGAATALFAATIAVGQYDIKKVLAYSTISQLGFMVAAVGMGATVAGMFHLVTHAFFKGLLFLAAGSVIQGVERGMHHGAHPDHDTDPQDMRQMGGLRKQMPLTFWVYLIGALALAGIAPLAGFFSKDEILAVCMANHNRQYSSSWPLPLSSPPSTWVVS